MLDGLRENFEIILVVLFLLSTVAYVIYRLTFHRNIKAEWSASKDAVAGMDKKAAKNLHANIISSNTDTPFKKVVYFFADLFWVLLFVFVVRSFLYEPFIIPSSSMKPGLQINDIVLVNKYELGLRMPITNTRLTEGRSVKRGDVIVFKFPNNPKISYIKRVIGLPGDKVYYNNRQMTINGKPVPLKRLRDSNDTVELHTTNGQVVEKSIKYTEYQEDLLGYKNIIRYADNYPAGYPPREWQVPEGKYLVMGDNRDNSGDGREFGFLDDKLLIGHATRIAFNFSCLKGDGMCDRFFKTIQ